LNTNSVEFHKKHNFHSFSEKTKFSAQHLAVLVKTNLLSPLPDKIHSFRVEKMCSNYTRFEWRRCAQTTPASSGEDVLKLHPLRVEKMCSNYTRFEWRRCAQTTLASSGEYVLKLHSFRVKKICSN
jgi:hypothetical protein